MGSQNDALREDFLLLVYIQMDPINSIIMSQRIQTKQFTKNKKNVFFLVQSTRQKTPLYSKQNCSVAVPD